MHLRLTERELRMVLDWRRQGAFFPDEGRVLRKLRHALEQKAPAQLSRLQIQIIHGWAEEQLGGPYGGGEVLNPEEAVLFGKIRDALGYGDRS